MEHTPHQQCRKDGCRLQPDAAVLSTEGANIAGAALAAKKSRIFIAFSFERRRASRLRCGAAVRNVGAAPRRWGRRIDGRLSRSAQEVGGFTDS